jgi:diacylglycerol kinase family enzyme
VRVSTDRPVPIEVDGRPAPPADRLAITVVPTAYRLLL